MPEKKIVAVLPFRVIGQGRGEGFYSEGISEILTGKLAQLTTVPGLQVISEFEINDRKVDTIEKARAEFGATLVLQGAVQFVNDQLLISYDLIDPVNRSELRAGSKKFSAADPIGAQEAVIRDIASLMQLELTPSARQTLRVFGTVNPRAFFLYTRVMVRRQRSGPQYGFSRTEELLDSGSWVCHWINLRLCPRATFCSRGSRAFS